MSVPAEGYEYRIDLADDTAVEQDLSPRMRAARAADAAAAQAAQAAASARQVALLRLQTKAITDETIRDLLTVLGI